MPAIKLLSNQIIDSKFTPDQLIDLLLKNRGLNKKSLETSPPDKLDFGINPTQFQKAIKRTKQAIANHENILIYGDYDVDGITATAILWRALNHAGAAVTPFIPDREADGYGLKAKSVANFQKQKNIEFSLIITVDNGIVANSEIAKIKTDLIITDHHLPDSKKPKATAIVHTTATSGSAVAWYLAKEFDPNADLGLAALGIVADCLPVTGINRSLIIFGLQSLQTKPCPGVQKLLEMAGIKKEKNITTYELGFILGPRINAVGRLSNPTDALRLLCAPSADIAAKYAATLNNFNADRQIMQQESLALAETLHHHDTKDKLIFVSDPSFHPGIIGLIAGRLTEKYYLPSIAISANGEVSKGSCRSIKELNIIETLREVSDLFIDLGGHPAAAGFSIMTSNIPKLQKKITKIINLKLKNVTLEPSLEIDAQMTLPATTNQNCQAIQKLQPFGLGNPEPLFIFNQIKLVSKRIVGATGDHLQLKFDDPATPKVENTVAAIGFKMGKRDADLKVGDLLNVIARLDVNVWNGKSTPQLIVKEIVNHGNNQPIWH